MKCARRIEIAKVLLGIAGHKPTPPCQVAGSVVRLSATLRGYCPFCPQVHGLQEVISDGFMTSVTFATMVRGCNLRA
jgi:hypothetical protein